MAIKLTNAAANAGINAVGNLPDVSGPGTIQIRTGSMPTTADDADAGTLLATLTLSADAFGAGSAGVATAAAITGANAVATGTAGYCVIKDGAAAKVFIGDVATSGAFLNLVSTSIVSGQPVSVTSMTLTLPKS